MNRPFFPVLLLLPVLAQAGDFPCTNLERCVNSVSGLTGERYVYDSGILKGEIGESPNLKLTRENADLVLTQMLDQNGLTRLPLDGSGTYTILLERYARDSALPIFEASPDSTPNFPENWDLAVLHYRLSHPEIAESIARTARSFLPETSRVIPDEIAGHLFFTAPIPILKNVLRLARAMDGNVSKEKIRRREKEYGRPAMPENPRPAPESGPAPHH